MSGVPGAFSGGTAEASRRTRHHVALDIGIRFGILASGTPDPSNERRQHPAVLRPQAEPLLDLDQVAGLDHRRRLDRLQVIGKADAL